MIFLGIAFAPLATFVLTLGVSCVFLINSLGSSAHEALESVVTDHARSIEEFLEERRGDMDFVLEAFPQAELSQSKTIESILDLLKRKSSAFVGLALIDAQEEHVALARSRNLAGGICEASDWFDSRVEPGRHVSGFVSGEAGETYFVVSKKSAPGTNTVLCATIRVDALLEIAKIGLGRSFDDIFLLDQDGFIKGWRGSETGGDSLTRFTLDPAADGRVVSFVHKDESMARHLIAAAPVGEGGWKLVVRQRFSAAFNDLIQTGWYLLAIILLGGVVTLSVATAVSRRIGNALKEADSARDVLRERLSRSVRLAELGEMTSGFAHEINNPLQVMESEITMMDMILNDFKESAVEDASGFERDLRDSLDELQRQIQRCSQVTKSILTFGRQDSSENKEFLLGDVMRDAIEMVRKKLEIKSIDLRFGIEPETLTVSGDIVNLRQVFLNLLNNAVYALAEKYAGEHGGGRLVFRARPYGQGWVVIEVTDNGPGIPKEVLANIYTPFFTTKPPQKGRGLGLAVCYGLIESMGGSIEVETWQGEGTVFRITLPAS
jgi:two-component system NtrC family sensor kinase